MDKWVKSHVRPACKLEINSRDGSVSFVLHPGARPIHNPSEVDNSLKDSAAVCLISDSSMRSASKPSGRIAMLSFATTAEYLAEQTRKQVSLLTALADRARWASQYNMPYVFLSLAYFRFTKLDIRIRRCYIWIGTMSDADAPIEGGSNKYGCNEYEKESLHIIKVIAMLALLDMTDDDERQYRFDTIMYTDMDTVPVRSDVSLEAYLDLDRDVDIIASSNPRNAIIMNSGVMFLRNSKWSRNFLEDWWRRRCGYKDQLSLWSTLFAGWSKSVPSFGDHPEVFHNYSLARKAALPLLIDIRRDTWPALRMEPWPCENICDKVLARNACITEPLRLPNVLLLPVGPFDNGRGRRLPPLQGTGSYGLFCHGHCGDLSRLSEKPLGCMQVLREMESDHSRPPTDQCESCRNHRCEQCTCDIPYRGVQRLPPNSRYPDSSACESAWEGAKVFGIGWRRTGLSSLREAFRLTGLLPACLVHKDNYDIPLCKSFVSRSPSWSFKSVLHLKEKYPEAKFVLTTREMGAWNTSLRESYIASKHQRGLGGSNRRLIAAHATYIENVLNLFSDHPGRLHVIDISQPPRTLSKLCDFIDPAIAATRPECSLPFPFKGANCRLHGQELGRNGAECALI